jgi:hypothetical protein
MGASAPIPPDLFLLIWPEKNIDSNVSLLYVTHNKFLVNEGNNYETGL